MFSLNEELRGEIKHINDTLLNKYREVLSMDKKLLRKFINNYIGKIKNWKK